MHSSALSASSEHEADPARADLMEDPLTATLTASRALLGVVARSLADALEVATLPQFRVMVILSGSGALRMGVLAHRVAAVPSTFSRFLGRMEAQGWIRREPSPDSRREVMVHLTPAAHALVAQVTERRRAELNAILDRLDPAEAEDIGRSLALFARAAGEAPPEDLLLLGL
jgi:DNA-binding MarR family transcriptional regulator